MTEYILAHDLGTTGNKATLFDSAGRIAASVFSPYPTYYPQQGWAEHDPNDWWTAVCESSRRLMDVCPHALHNLAGIGLSGMMNGCLLVDNHGNSIGSSIIHADIRSAEQCRSMESRIGEERAYLISGNRLAPNFTLGKLAWLKDNRLELLKGAQWCVQTKDFIGAKLTGVWGVTDYSDASLTGCFDMSESCWSPELIEAAGFSEAILPEVRSSADLLGRITRDAANETGLPEGTPVVVGGGDGACATAGAGAFCDGDAYHYLGGSSWVAVVTQGFKPDMTRRVSSFCTLEAGKFVLYGTVQSAGSSLDWFLKAIGIGRDISAEATFEQLENLASEAPPGSNGLLFLPYLMGERSPIWDADARGVFFGLSASHGRADMARAVYEGVSYALASNLSALTEAAGAIGKISALGGGMRSELWRKMLASIYGTPLQLMGRLSEATSCGAAMAAALGIGIYTSYDAACSNFAPIAEMILPEEAISEFYSHQLAFYNAMYPKMSGLFTELAKLRRRDVLI